MPRASTETVSVNVTAYGLWQMKLGGKSLDFEVAGRTLVTGLVKMGGKGFSKDVLSNQRNLAD